MKHKKSDPKVALRLFLYFFRIGWFTFGGGFSIIAQMQKDFVDKMKLVDEQKLLDQTSIGRSLPGLMVANVAYLFGYDQGGLLAGVTSVFGIITPPVIMLSIVTMCYTAFRDNKYVARAMMGVRAAVVPIIISALRKLFKSGMKDVFCYIVALGAMALCLFTGINNVLIVVMGAAAGLMYMEVRSRHAVR